MSPHDPPVPAPTPAAVDPTAAFRRLIAATRRDLTAVLGQSPSRDQIADLMYTVLLDQAHARLTEGGFAPTHERAVSLLAERGVLALLHEYRQASR